MIAGLLGMALANAAVLLGARSVLEKVRTGHAPTDFVLFLLLRLSLISAVVLIAGLCQALASWKLGLAGLLCLALGLLRKPRPGQWRLGPLPDVDPALLLLLACVAVRLLLQVWFFAPNLGDSVAYRLPQMAEWIRVGGFTRETGNDIRGTFPAGLELVEAWWVVFLHHDVLIEMAGVEFLLLASAAAFAMAKRLGLTDRGAWLAAAIYALTPTLHFQATACINDGPAAAMTLAALVLVAARASWGLVLLAVGMGAGIKAPCVFALPGVVALAFLLRNEPKPPKPAPGWAVGLGLAGILLGSYWFARNQVVFGNALYPIRGLGILQTPGVRIQVGPSLGNFYLNLISLLDERISDRNGGYGPLAPRASGWGPVAYSVGLLALLVRCRSDLNFRRWAAAMTASLLSVLFLVIWDDWVVRFVLFFPALLAAAAARMAEENRGLRLMIAGGLVVAFVGTGVPEELAGDPIRSLVRQGWRERALPTPPPPVEANAAVALIGALPAPVPAYAFYRPDFSRRVVYVRATSAEELMRILRREAVVALYASPGEPIPAEAAKRGWLRPIQDGYWGDTGRWP